jgi:hypothetical protein
MRLFCPPAHAVSSTTATTTCARLDFISSRYFKPIDSFRDAKIYYFSDMAKKRSTFLLTTIRKGKKTRFLRRPVSLAN